MSVSEMNVGQNIVLNKLTCVAILSTSVILHKRHEDHSIRDKLWPYVNL